MQQEAVEAKKVVVEIINVMEKLKVRFGASVSQSSFYRMGLRLLLNIGFHVEAKAEFVDKKVFSIGQR